MAKDVSHSTGKRGPGSPSKGKRIRPSLRLPSKLHARAARLAKQKRWSLNKMCVIALRFWLKHRKGNKKKA